MYMQSKIIGKGGELTMSYKDDTDDEEYEILANKIERPEKS